MTTCALASHVTRVLTPVLIALVLAAAAGSAFALLPARPPGALASQTTAEAAGAEAPEPFVLEWEGYLRAGVADRFAHTRETEPLVAPLARMGFVADVPEGTTRLGFSLLWEGDATMHVMVHAPESAGMPTYMAMESASGASCLVVPPAEVVGGAWMVMAHGDDQAKGITFKIVVETLGPSPALAREGDHGHGMNEEMAMDHRDALACDA